MAREGKILTCKITPEIQMVRAGGGGPVISLYEFGKGKLKLLFIQFMFPVHPWRDSA